MSKNYELDALKSREQDAFQRKQVAFQMYADAKERCAKAHDTMQAAWDERSAAKEEMNREYDEIQRSSERYREVWDEYGRIRDQNNFEIERLRAEADSEHREMKYCFERASDCYENGDKSEAPYWSQQGHEHKDRRNEINEEVRSLCQIVKNARQNAEWRAPKTDSSAFHQAKSAFEQAKTRHKSAQAELKRLEAERDRLKAEFDARHAEHTRLKEEFQQKLKEFRANNQRKRDRILNKASVSPHWTAREQGVILGENCDHEVTFRQGIGPYEGQTLIADGHVNKRQFDRHHNHYGKNNRAAYPNEMVDRIEDSSKHKDDDAYTGPGH